MNNVRIEKVRESRKKLENKFDEIKIFAVNCDCGERKAIQEQPPKTFPKSRQ